MSGIEIDITAAGQHRHASQHSSSSGTSAVSIIWLVIGIVFLVLLGTALIIALVQRCNNNNNRQRRNPRGGGGGGGGSQEEYVPLGERNFDF